MAARFSIKDNAATQFFANRGERTPTEPREIIVDGTLLHENPATANRGFGCISANGSSRLLLDYKAEHPHVYEEIMRLLFEKDYGASLGHIKIELGADVNSSSGCEPCTKRESSEQADVTRGAGFQFAADAKAINPEITLDLLRWGEPAWVTRAFAISQERGFFARYNWYKETIEEAYKIYGLKFDYISADQNEPQMPDENWILFLRYQLDHDATMLYDYSAIRLVAADEVGECRITGMMADDERLRNAISVIGLHYRTYGDGMTKTLSEASTKEFWYSEGAAPCNMPELTTQADASGLVGPNAAIDIATRIINSHSKTRMTLYEYQPAVAAYYEGSQYSPKQLIRAWEPWSGNYVLDIGFWMTMHFSRFSQKGWLHVNVACYGDGEENQTIWGTTHNYMTLASPDRMNFSIFFTNEDDTPRVYAVQVQEMGIAPTTLSTVITQGPSARQAYNANWFKQGKPIKMTRGKSRGKKGDAQGVVGPYFLVKVPPRSIMTVTTLNTDWVQGVNTFSRIQPPKPHRLNLPYRDNLDYSLEEICIRGCAPRYMTDQGGAFELVETNEGCAICQQITPRIMPTNWNGRVTPSPITCFGDDRWYNYSMEAEVRLANSSKANWVGIGIRYNSAVTCEYTAMCGYSARIYGNGSWKIYDMDQVAAEGIIKDFVPLDWHTLKLMIIGGSIFFFYDGRFMAKYTPVVMVNSGRAFLCSEYAHNLFRHIAIEPVAVGEPYVRRVDCFGDGLVYNENWGVETMESYAFYHRTSMEAREGATFRCSFDGTGIAVIGTARNVELTVIVDGKTLYEHLHIAKCLPRQTVVSIEGLALGRHTLQIYLVSGEFKLDVLEVPESAPEMPDMLLMPQSLQQEEGRERMALGEILNDDATFMEADAMLYHMEHPFAPIPKEMPKATGEDIEPPAATGEMPEADNNDNTEESDAENIPENIPENAPEESAEATESPVDTEEAETPETPEEITETPKKSDALTPVEMFAAFGEEIPEGAENGGGEVEERTITAEELAQLLGEDEVK